MAKAKEVRRDIVKMTAAAGSGHPGGSLSAVEILCSLYFNVLRHDPKNPHWEERDRFILSKGHASPVLYSTLAEAGYLPVDQLMTFRKLGSVLQG
ncbi:MAG: transketolase, partial [bacterium]